MMGSLMMMRLFNSPSYPPQRGGKVEDKSEENFLKELGMKN